MGSAVHKARRRQAILDLVRDEPIANQDELARALARRGHPAGQSTLSRDLKDLRILRVPTEHGYRYCPAGEEPVRRAGPPGPRSLTPAEVTGVEANEVAVVVRTLVGRAQGVAVYLDALGLPDVLGTIAGDDTILVLPRSTRSTRKLLAQLADLFGLRPRGVRP